MNKSSAGSKNSENQIWEFFHPKFIRGKPLLLEEIRRKPLENSNSNSSDNWRNSSALLQHRHAAMSVNLGSDPSGNGYNNSYMGSPYAYNGKLVGMNMNTLGLAHKSSRGQMMATQNQVAVAQAKAQAQAQAQLQAQMAQQQAQYQAQAQAQYQVQQQQQFQSLPVSGQGNVYLQQANPQQQQPQTQQQVVPQSQSQAIAVSNLPGHPDPNAIQTINGLVVDSNSSANLMMDQATAMAATMQVQQQQQQQQIVNQVNNTTTLQVIPSQMNEINGGMVDRRSDPNSVATGSATPYGVIQVPSQSANVDPNQVSGGMVMAQPVSHQSSQPTTPQQTQAPPLPIVIESQGQPSQPMTNGIINGSNGQPATIIQGTPTNNNDILYNIKLLQMANQDMNARLSELQSGFKNVLNACSENRQRIEYFQQLLNVNGQSTTAQSAQPMMSSNGQIINTYPSNTTNNNAAAPLTTYAVNQGMPLYATTTEQPTVQAVSSINPMNLTNPQHLLSPTTHNAILQNQQPNMASPIPTPPNSTTMNDPQNQQQQQQLQNSPPVLQSNSNIITTPPVVTSSGNQNDIIYNTNTNTAINNGTTTIYY